MGRHPEPPKAILAIHRWVPHHTCTRPTMVHKTPAKECLLTAMVTLVATHSVLATPHTRATHPRGMDHGLEVLGSTLATHLRVKVATHHRDGGLMDLIWGVNLAHLLLGLLRDIPNTLG